MSRFSYSTAPMIRFRRSQFDLSRRHLTTINMGALVPIYWEEVLPGDTIKGHIKEVIRTTTPFLKPIMDNLFVDTYFFYVPNRLVMTNWQQVFGDTSGQSSWTSPQLKEVPSIGYDESVADGIDPQSLADYFGIPTGVTSANLQASGDISSLLFRAYALIWNEWFRDENNEDPVLIQLGDSQTTPVGTENLNSNPWSASNYTGAPAYVNKVHDRFTSALPAPQKGAPVGVTLESFAPGTLFPVRTSGTLSAYSSEDSIFPLLHAIGPVSFSTSSFQSYLTDSVVPSGGYSIGTDGALSTAGAFTPNSITYNSSSPFNQYAQAYYLNRPAFDSGAQKYLYPYVGVMPSSVPDVKSNLYATAPVNLFADASGVPLTGQAFDINDLRYAFQLQRYLEADARGGSRYIEFLRQHFGVIAGDARLQRPEYLGGKRTPISIYQQNQTSASTVDDPLGQVAAWSLTQSDSGFNKSFPEHGFVIGLCCVRQFHTYQQGIHPAFYRHNRYDYYDPVFAHIGEQPVYTRELYVGDGVTDETVFGYQEAYNEYRQGQNRVSGYMRSSAPQTLDIWHLADVYSNAPVLGQQFLQESPINLNRVLTAPSTTAPNFLLDTYADIKAVRTMPTYGYPGLIDHVK